MAGEDHSQCDCFGLAVLTHGDTNVLFGTDTLINIDNLIAPIKKSDTLAGKPKIFLFQVNQRTRNYLLLKRKQECPQTVRPGDTENAQNATAAHLSATPKLGAPTIRAIRPFVWGIRVDLREEVENNGTNRNLGPTFLTISVHTVDRSCTVWEQRTFLTYRHIYRGYLAAQEWRFV